MSHRNIGIKDNLVCLVVLANGLTSLFQCVSRRPGLSSDWPVELASCASCTSCRRL
jgi:hypothetical protein